MVINIVKRDYINLRMAANYFEAVKMPYKCFYELKPFMNSVYFLNTKIPSINNKYFMHVALFEVINANIDIDKISFGNLSNWNRYEWQSSIDIKDLSRYLKLQALW